MKKVLLGLGVAVALCVTAAYPLALASGSRSDCPGKIVCPITGEAVCSDQCPLGDAAASDASVPSCCAVSE